MRLIIEPIHLLLFALCLSSIAVLLIVASETSARSINSSEGEPDQVKEAALTKREDQETMVANDDLSKSIEASEQNKFTFVEALSQNSALSNGLKETGQPVIISLVDTAVAELQETLPSITKLLNHSDNADAVYTINGSNSDVDKIQEINDTYKDNIINTTKENEIPKSSGEPPPLIVVAEPKLEIKIENNVKTPDINITENFAETETNNITLNLVNNLTKSQPEFLKPNESPEDIPSFSEWAQKQLEEAEKKDTVLNQSTQSSHISSPSNSKQKLRSKNYASPDCGAKIVAANPEAGSPSSILSLSKDEYMLNTCNSRIWFVVELCEPIQAKKVELANFELFSSSPKEFTVFFSDRFPTREWTSVGQFTAKDERDIQTFNLQPFIFGKFIKVELLSHYGSEHYCPVSLFKVYGTSEFEVLETENLIHSHEAHIEDDDEEDDIHIEANKPTDSSKNLFGSARDAVMSIMKRAAEVLVKSNEPKNSSDNSNAPITISNQCFTPSHIIVCDNCSDSMYGDVFELLSCSSNRINNLIESMLIYKAIQNSDVCDEFGLDFKNKRSFSYKNDTAVYISTLFMPSYIAALCNVLAIKEKKVVLNTSFEADSNSTSNLTIDSAINSVKLDENIEKVIQEPFINTPQKLCENNDISKSAFEYVDSNELNIKPTKTVKTDSYSVETIPTITTTNKNIEQVETIEIDKISTTVTVMTPKTEETMSKGKSSIKENNTFESTLKENSEKTENETQIKVDNHLNDSNQNDTLSNNTNGMNLLSDEISINEQISLDNFLSDLDQVATEAGSIGIQTSTPSPNIASLPQGQKESVFLRLSNRIKSLERNMSLSSQYLEELSKRYKKQVEEMQKTFEKTTTTMTEENQRALEREIKMSEHIGHLQQEMARLNSVIEMLMIDRDSWFGNLTFFKYVVFQVLILSVFAYLLLRSSTDKQLTSNKKTNKGKRNQTNKTVVRRKSVEGVSGHRTPSSKKRRPSEEALEIERHSYENEIAEDINKGDWIPVKYDKKKRKRKISVMCRPGYLTTTNENPFDIDLNVKTHNINQPWSKEIVKKSILENTIALEEPEFIIPGIEPIDFEKIAVEMRNGSVDVKGYNNTNGSAIDQKSGSKPIKTRRLSSPAFLKSALSRQSSRNSSSPPKKQGQLSATENSIPSTSLQSSIVDVSLNGKTPVAELCSDNKIKRGKSKSFKSIFKKVF